MARRTFRVLKMGVRPVTVSNENEEGRVEDTEVVLAAAAPVAIRLSSFASRVRVARRDSTPDGSVKAIFL